MDYRTLFSLLRRCIVSKSIKPGKIIHQKIITLGLQQNTSLCKTLIEFYLSFQLSQSAKLVFQSIETPLENSFWNGILAAYTKNYLFKETLEVFDRLLVNSFLKPDHYTYPSVFRACAGLNRVFYGQNVHAQTIKNGCLLDVVVASSMARMYFKCDMFDHALQVFDEMTDRDAACWNTLMSCYYQMGQCEKALELFEEMKLSGFKPNSVTITTAISCCARLMDLERGKKIQEEFIRKEFLQDDFVSTSLVNMYAKCGCMEMAKEFFEQISDKTLTTWNSIIGGFSLMGDSYACIELFRRMAMARVRPSLTTLTSLLMASSRSANLIHGKLIHGYLIRNNIDPDIFIYSSLLDFYFKCDKVASAETIFQKMPRSNVVAWNVMISGYVSSGSFFEALGLFAEMKEAGIEPDDITFITSLTACSQLTALEQGKEIHGDIIDRKLENNEIVMGALLQMYAKCGAVLEASKIFSELPERDLISWTSMITAYGNHGQAVDALKLFEEMLQSNMKPDRVTFLAVISACSHAGLVDEGFKFFNCMVSDYGIEPTVEDYSCLIDLLGRAGRLREAYDFIQRTGENVKDNVEILSTIFSACHLQGELELGEEIGKVLMEKDRNNPATYVALSKMYASIDEWKNARAVRVNMEEKGLRKKPGCSWIEVDKRMETFLVEDKMHPQAELIYDCLGTLSLHGNG
ncbi:pentatricopeptide repeat-containing protein At5g27110 [Impatiens glandulifera]|uniref:pentatricopeptide repeat-containing protein At5g27110 n=1 Tax=Impatiens glandulifera TaxID=253017 RepID=UPI001FB050E0|nr:pentatricopeptide repeat-containing protein At5g27110 [Impatiens glandulifera]